MGDRREEKSLFDGTRGIARRERHCLYREHTEQKLNNEGLRDSIVGCCELAVGVAGTSRMRYVLISRAEQMVDGPVRLYSDDNPTKQHLTAEKHGLP